MKKTLIRLQCLLLALLMTAGLFGCAKNTPSHGKIDDSLISAAGERFVPLTLDLPENWSFRPGCAAELDPDTGNVLLTAVYGERSGDYGACAVFAFSPDGNRISETDLDAAEGEILTAAAFSGDSLWAILETASETGSAARLCRFDASDGSLKAETDLYALDEMPGHIPVERMAADGDGDLWLVSGSAVFAYSPDFRLLSSVRLNGAVSSLAVDPDGRVWASAVYGNSGERGAVRLNKSTGGYDETVTLDPTNRNLAFGADGSLYYDTQNGIRCIRTDSEGRKTVHPIMSFLASGIVWSEGGSLVSGEGGTERSELVLAVGETLLFRSVKPGAGRLDCTPVLYSPAGEEDDADVVTLQVAFAHELSSSFKPTVVRFNAEHPDIQISLLDYSVYDGKYDAGAEKLLLDMTTGIVSPDIVVGGTDSLEIMTLARKKMTRDLLPYFEKEEELNPDNIFGIALRYYDNGEGGLWGFAPTFLTDTFVSTRELLGPYGSDEGWGLEEFLDFVETVPEGRGISRQYGYRSVNCMYQPGLYESFVDRKSGTCSFDSPLFVRLLEYFMNLPTWDEVTRDQPEVRERNELYKAGFYALADVTGVPGEGVFGTPDFVIVGYPSNEPAGRVKFQATTFVISKRSAHPEEAWEYLRSVFLDPEMRGDSTSPLKSDFDATTEEARNKIWLHFEDGGWTTWPVPPEEYDEVTDQIKALFDVMEPGRTYRIEPMPEEQRARTRAWLDSAGGRGLDLLPPEVNELVREEISAYLKGVGTAEDCAKKIQSRVSIWLEENR